MKPTVCAAIVTYNRKELLRKCILSLLGQSRKLDEIVVVDNASTDGTADMVRREFPEVHICSLESNLGASGGFYAGVKWGYERGFDWIWVTDDDAVFCLTAWERTLESTKRCSTLQNGPFALWSNVVPRDPGDVVPPPEPPLDDLGEDRDVEHGMFVGFAIPRSTVKSIGLPRRDLFIYCDDVDYCLRIRREGGQVIQVARSIVFHKDWQQHTLRKKFLGIPITYPDIPSWKVYYLLRNQLLAYRHSGSLRRLRDIARVLVFLVKSLLVRPGHIPRIVKGGLHGLLGVSGIRCEPGAGRGNR